MMKLSLLSVLIFLLMSANALAVKPLSDMDAYKAIMVDGLELPDVSVVKHIINMMVELRMKLH